MKSLNNFIVLGAKIIIAFIIFAIITKIIN